MKKLGISVYPEMCSEEEVFNYIYQASTFGFSRLFICLLSVDESKEYVIKKYRKINSFAKNLGFEIIVDVTPKVLEKYNVSVNDLSFFKEIQADTISLDAGYGGNEEAMLSFNKEQLKIGINASNDVHTIDTIIDYQPNRDNLVGRFNFYPHRYTGLALEYFRECSKRFMKYGIKCNAYITSQAKQTFGPWPVTQGLPTLEMHRSLPIDVQLKHLILEDCVDEISISNCFPTTKEMQDISKVSLEHPSFKISIETTCSEIERKIITEELHFNRGDINENVIRSTQSRVKYKGCSFPLHNAPKMITRGDIIIESEEYGHYAGELQIAIRDMENSGYSNVVGRIDDAELFLLDMLKPWQKFTLYE